MASKTVEILLNVKDLTRSGLQSAQSSISEFRNKVNAKDGSINQANQAMEAVAKTAKVLGLIQTLAAGVEVAVQGWNTASAVFSGNVEQAEKGLADFKATIEGLPMGIGQVAKAGASIREAITGERKEIEKINKETEEREQKLKKITKALEGEKKALEEIKKQAQGLYDVAAKRNVTIVDEIEKMLYGGSGDFKGAEYLIEKEIARQKEQISKSIEDAQAKITDFQNQKKNPLANSGEIDKQIQKTLEAISIESAALANLDQVKELRLKKLDEEQRKADEDRWNEKVRQMGIEADEIDKRIDDYRREQEAKRKIAEDTAKSIADYENENSKKRAGTEIAMLRLVGKDKKASQLDILNQFEEEVLQAQKAASKILDSEHATDEDKARATETLSGRISDAENMRNLQLGLLESEAGKSNSLSMRSSRFLTGATDRQEPQVKELNKLIELGQKQNEILERMAGIRGRAQELELVIAGEY